MNKSEKEVYEKTLSLFGGCCALCGSNRVQLHHIRYGGMQSGRKTYMGNVIPLCKYHHDLVHTNKRMYMPVLIKIIDERMRYDASIYNSSSSDNEEESPTDCD